MDAEEARQRLGLDDDDVSPRAVLRAHHKVAASIVRLPPATRAEVLGSIDVARDTLLGTLQPGDSNRPEAPQPGDSNRPEAPQPGDSNRPEAPQPGDSNRPEAPQPGDSNRPEAPQPGDSNRPEAPQPGGSRVLEALATPRGMAALTAAGVVLAAVQLVNASATVLGGLAFALLGLALVLSIRRRRKVASVLLGVAVVVSAALVARRVTGAGTQQFATSGGEFLTSPAAPSPFARQVGIPLTADPSTGRVDQTLIDEPATFVVSCLRSGPFQNRRPDILWAYVAEGDYKSYWVPLGYLGALRPGAARTLLSCSDWRWQLQYFGSP